MNNNNAVTITIDDGAPDDESGIGDAALALAKKMVPLINHDLTAIAIYTWRADAIERRPPVGIIAWWFSGCKGRNAWWHGGIWLSKKLLLYAADFDAVASHYASQINSRNDAIFASAAKDEKPNE